MRGGHRLGMGEPVLLGSMIIVPVWFVVYLVPPARAKRQQ